MNRTLKEQQGKITIVEIAKELNISTSTVSRALNDNSKISDATKQRVREVAKKMGYELNLVASSLSKNKTNLIGIILPKLNSHFFSNALSGIQEIAKGKGYQVIICQTDESSDQEKEMVKALNAARVDGVIASLTVETRDISHFDVLKRNKIPVAMFDRVHFDIPGPKIVIDNYEGAYRATEHLIKTGCKRIAHLAGPQECKVFEERAKGFTDALKNNGVSLPPQFLLASDLNEKDAHDAFQFWMNKKERPDAIFTSNVTTGLIINTLSKNHGIKVPDDLSLITFGNEPCNEYIVPSLSAVEMPGKEMGKSAAAHLINAIESKKEDNRVEIKPFQLLIRNSSFMSH